MPGNMLTRILKRYLLHHDKHLCQSTYLVHVLEKSVDYDGILVITVTHINRKRKRVSNNLAEITVRTPTLGLIFYWVNYRMISRVIRLSP